MSTRNQLLRHPAAVLLTTGALLLTPSVALADPPALNRDACSVLLAHAAHWPGSVRTASGTVRLVSDAYASHLSAQPPCSSAGG